MSIIKFEHLPVTTMTALILLDGTVDIRRVFGLLEMAKFANIETFRATKKQKIPICDKPGTLITATFDNKTRGYVKTEISTGWRNSIMIDIATKCKNVNIKLSNTTIHMCGSVSEELCYEVGNYMINNIKKVQENLDYIKENKEKCQETLNWLKVGCRGDSYIVDRNTQQIIDFVDHIENEGFLFDGDGHPYISEIMAPLSINVEYTITEYGQILDNKQEYLYIYTVSNEHYIGTLKSIETTWPDIYKTMVDSNLLNVRPIHIVMPRRVNSVKIPEEYYNGYPDGVDARIANFFIECLPDYQYYDEYMDFIDEVLTYDRIYTEPLTIKELFPLMVNYSYSLGFCIDRSKLAQLIHGRAGFWAFYNNTTDHCVKIILPYEPTAEMKAIDNLRYNKDQKKKRKYQHSFMVYKSGLVTQSGPNLKMVEYAYNKFNTLISNYITDISQPDGPHVIKYRNIRDQNPYINMNEITDKSKFDPIDITDNNVDNTEIFQQGQGTELDFLDFLEIFDIYWEIIDNAQQDPSAAIDLFHSLVPEEQVEIAKLNALLYEKLYAKISIHVPKPSALVSICLAYGQFIVKNIYINPDQIINLPQNDDISTFLQPSDIKPPPNVPQSSLIEKKIMTYWKTFMLP